MRCAHCDTVWNSGDGAPSFDSTANGAVRPVADFSMPGNRPSETHNLIVPFVALVLAGIALVFLTDQVILRWSEKTSVALVSSISLVFLIGNAYWNAPTVPDAVPHILNRRKWLKWGFLVSIGSLAFRLLTRQFGVLESSASIFSSMGMLIGLLFMIVGHSLAHRSTSPSKDH